MVMILSKSYPTYRLVRPFSVSKEKNGHVRLCVDLERLNLADKLDLLNFISVSEFKRIIGMIRYLWRFLINVVDVI